PAFALLKAELAKKRALLHVPEGEAIPPGKRVQPGGPDGRLSLVRHHLERLGYLTAKNAPSKDTEGNPVLDREMTEALKAFQSDAQLRSWGGLDQATVNALNDRTEQRNVTKLIYNIERLRWLPKNLGKRYVFVNQAAYQLQIIDDGREVWRTKV